MTATDIDDEDFLDIDDEDTPRSPLNRSGVLVVPGIAICEAAFEAESVGFSAGRPVMFVHADEDTGGEVLDNIDELRDAGFVGATVADAEEWMSPKNEKPDRAREAAILAARGDL